MRKFLAVILLACMLPIQAVAQQSPPVCDGPPGGGVLAYPCERPPDCGGFWDILLHPIQYMDCRAYEDAWLEYWTDFWVSLGVPWP